jgi:hypothetical protein
MMAKTKPQYGGPERRRRRIYVTRNTEYHFLDDVCVAVKSRASNKWRLGHAALNHALTGCVRFAGDGEVQPKSREPELGDALFFADRGCDVITSVLIDIQRPSLETVESYPI